MDKSANHHPHPTLPVSLSQLHIGDKFAAPTSITWLNAHEICRVTRGNMGGSIGFLPMRMDGEDSLPLPANTLISFSPTVRAIKVFGMYKDSGKMHPDCTVTLLAPASLNQPLVFADVIGGGGKRSLIQKGFLIMSGWQNGTVLADYCGEGIWVCANDPAHVFGWDWAQDNLYMCPKCQHLEHAPLLFLAKK